MRQLFQSLACLAAMVVAIIATPAAAATCTVTGISGGNANAGRYTGAAISKDLGGTALTITVARVGTGASCSGSIAFQRSPATAVMTGASGGTLRYDIASSSGSLIAAGNWATGVPFVYSGGGNSFTVTLSGVTLSIAGGSVPAAGGYDDTNIAVVVLDGTSTAIASGAFLVSASVNPSCTINGTTMAVDPSEVRFPVSAAGVVATDAIARTYQNVMCNAPADITMTSQNGGLTTAAAASAGLTNVIPYSAQATFGGATARLDTATAITETGKLNTTFGASGGMTVTMTPQRPALRLVAGRYSDVLSIVLTPQ